MHRSHVRFSVRCPRDGPAGRGRATGDRGKGQLSTIAGWLNDTWWHRGCQGACSTPSRAFPIRGADRCPRPCRRRRARGLTGRSARLVRGGWPSSRGARDHRARSRGGSRYSADMRPVRRGPLHFPGTANPGRVRVHRLSGKRCLDMRHLELAEGAAPGGDTCRGIRGGRYGRPTNNRRVEERNDRTFGI